jgi:hypothetical protein
MSTTASIPLTGLSTHTLTQSGRALLLSATVLVALALYYFIGVDEGMASVFGNTLVIHEWVHDARHFLGFPCH